MSLYTESRKCIGCSCHMVPYNQGSAYCDVCWTQSYRQIPNHRDAAKVWRTEKSYTRKED